MRNILLEIAFIGTAYSGWQRQKNGLAVQEVVEKAISAVTAEDVKLTGCSRTDAGVHAEQFFANFKTESSIPTERFRPALQSKLPGDILIKKSTQVGSRFDARRDALEKIYRYQIFSGRSPFCNDRWWQCPLTIDSKKLPPLARLVVGEHDFSGFCVRRSLKESNLCRITEATWRLDGRRLYFKITGNRFLHRMVRFLVGAQVEVAAGKLSKSDFESIILRPTEFRALYPAPPEGLYLNRVRHS
jgi:tRNA pseudouridine38-40 synthase